MMGRSAGAAPGAIWRAMARLAPALTTLLVASAAHSTFGMSAGCGAGQRGRKASEAGAHEGVRIKTEVRSTRKFGAHVSSEHT